MQQALDKSCSDQCMVIKQKRMSMPFYSKKKAHLTSISDVPIYNSILILLHIKYFSCRPIYRSTP